MAEILYGALTMATASALTAISPDLIAPQLLVQRDQLLLRQGERPPIQPRPITHADTSPIAAQVSVPQALLPDPARNRFSGSLTFSVQQSYSVSFSLHLGGIESMGKVGAARDFQPAAHFSGPVGRSVDERV